MLMTVEWRKSPYGLAKQHKLADQSAKKELNYQWWYRMLPQHFEASAVRRYDYKKRTKAYQLRKSRTLGHQRPNVYSGKLYSRMTRQMPSIVQRGKGTSMRFTGLPKYVYYRSGTDRRGRYFDRPNIPLELIVVDDHDQQELLKKYETSYMQEMQKAGYTGR